VVDNASDNDSFRHVKEAYEIKDAYDIKDVYDTKHKLVFLSNESNLGFARGLNVGIRYARRKWQPKFIVTLNNDTMLLPGSFFTNIALKYDQTRFAVMGPMILSKDGRYTANPMLDAIKTKEQAKQYLLYCQMLRLLNRFFLATLYLTISKSWNRPGKKNGTSASLQEQRNMKLHGSALIFSPTYFHEWDGLDESTFLFMEEDILLFHLQKKNLLSLYSPEIKIYHKEDSATDYRFKSSLSKRDMMCKHFIHSLKAYIKIIEESEITEN
jgi:GT2 family glycosyltransferase